MKQHNSFRSIDAFEYVKAYEKALNLQIPDIKDCLKCLNDRMGDNPNSFLLAAYRGYEDALSIKEMNKVPTIVVLDQSQ